VPFKLTVELPAASVALEVRVKPFATLRVYVPSVKFPLEEFAAMKLFVTVTFVPKVPPRCRVRLLNDKPLAVRIFGAVEVIWIVEVPDEKPTFVPDPEVYESQSPAIECV
jgi:hypothetical protein